MKAKGLTITIIFEAQSLNYDEGYGNFSILKKMHRANGKTYSYSSRQSLRYSMFIQGVKEFGWVPSDVINSGSGEKHVIQLISNIQNSEESDLFGYMKTGVSVKEADEEKFKATVTRVSPVRIIPAMAMEPFENDIEMLTNKYQADKKNLDNNIANIEHQRSLFRYTICIDLHRIGNENDDISTKIMPGKSYNETKHREFLNKYTSDIRKMDVGKELKIKRVSELLDIIGTFYRDIKGRREDLKPLFVIGGVYDTLNPFFENTIMVNWKQEKPEINLGSIIQQLSDDADEETHAKIKNSTFIGIRDDFFTQSVSKIQTTLPENIRNNIGSPEFVISHLKKQISNYYES